MKLPESASEAYDLLSKRLSNLKDLSFFREHVEWEDLLPVAKEVKNFLLARAAMLIDDAASQEKLPKLLDFEWEEVREEKEEDKIIAEAGDVGFFALCIAIIHWDDIPEGSSVRQQVLDGLTMADNEAWSRGVALDQAISAVAKGKNSSNYPSVLYQLKKDERTAEIPDRVKITRSIVREIRPNLNGEFKDSPDLAGALLREAKEEKGLSVMIMELLTISGLGMAGQAI